MSAAPAGFGVDVGVLDLEPPPLNAFVIINFRASDEVRVSTVDHHRQAVNLLDDVARARVLLKAHRVPVASAARTPTRLVNVYPQVGVLGLLVLQDLGESLPRDGRYADQRHQFLHTDINISSSYLCIASFWRLWPLHSPRLTE